MDRLPSAENRCVRHERSGLHVTERYRNAISHRTNFLRSTPSMTFKNWLSLPIGGAIVFPYKEVAPVQRRLILVGLSSVLLSALSIFQLPAQQPNPNKLVGTWKLISGKYNGQAADLGKEV